MVYAGASGESTGIVPGDGQPFGKYEPAIEMRVIKEMDQSQSSCRESRHGILRGNAVNKQVLNTLGIKLKYDWVVPREQFNTKWNLTIASGASPDVMTMKVIQFQELVKADVLRDMTEYVDQYASPTLKMLYEWDENFTRKAVTIGARCSRCPSPGRRPTTRRSSGSEGPAGARSACRFPRRWRSLLKVARAFASDDPDGNGKKDTYAMALNKTLDGGLSDINGFLNGYGAYFDIWVKDGDKLVYSSVQPQVKTGAAGAERRCTPKSSSTPSSRSKIRSKKARWWSRERSASSTAGRGRGRRQHQGQPPQGSQGQWLPNQVPGVKEADHESSEVQASASLNGMTFVGVNKKYAHPEAAVKLGQPLRHELLWRQVDRRVERRSTTPCPTAAGSHDRLSGDRDPSPWNDYNQYLQLKDALAAKDRNKRRLYVQVGGTT